MRKYLFYFVTALSVIVSACGNATQPCGTFTFTGAPNGSRGVDVVVNFNFNPATCGASCSNNTVAYIQIVRIIDRDTGNFLAPNSDQQNRIVTGNADATQNGWAVDRLSDRQWGYYGRFNDGTFATTLTPGSNTTTATLRDSPSGWPDNAWFDAVSVPVCIAGTTCNNTMDGYYYWLFIVSPGGSTNAPFNEVGVDWMQNAVDRSVIEWNNDAPGLSKHSFPALSRL